MKLKIKITLLLFLASMLNIQAQNEKTHICDHKCGTDHAMQKHYEAHPESKKEAEAFSLFTKKFKSEDRKATAYVIPVVFHVFGTNFNGYSVDDALIIDALKRTNEDFQGITSDWNDVISEFSNVKQPIDITFKLAQIDPDGNATTGITYHPEMSGFGNGSGYDSQIQQYAWDNYKYFNVYIQNDLYNDGSTTNSGVCWYPDTWMSDNNLARCVYNGAYIGNNTSENFRSVLTHEFGHYLNLIHTFEGGCPDSGGCSSSGDECCDTPPADNSSLQAGDMNCNGNITNWQNFMNYSDQYANYTIEQVDRMEAALQHAARKPLWQESNLVATGVSEDLGPRLMLSTTLFEESYQNNGSVSTSADLSAIDGATFAVTGNLSSGTHFTASNVPSGLSVTINISSTTAGTVTLTGTANSHSNSYDVSNMSITFRDAAIQGGASSLYSATLNNLKIDFIDPYQIISEQLSGVEVYDGDDDAVWEYFEIQNGEAYGAWFHEGNLRLETYQKPLVCQGSTRNISKLAYNTTINSSSNWVEGGAYPDEHDLRTSSYTTWDGATAYIGFQFEFKGHPCYGWFKAVVNSNGSSYQITEYAYNEEPYGVIVAGKTDGGGSDTEPPSTPTNLSYSNVTATGVSLSWTASTDNEGVTGYDVMNGSTVIESSTGTSVTIGGLNPSTQYTLQVRAKDAAGNISGLSNSVTFTTVEQGCIYCTSESNRSSYEHIAEVKVGSFTKTSGAANYSDFTSEIIELNKNENTSITLTPGFSGDAYAEYFRIWIDLNDDCDFDDSGEMVFDAGSASTSAVNGTINVPASAITGVTRMRVSMKYNGAPNQCDNGSDFGDGEVEDYTVNISVGGGDTEPPSTPTNLNFSNVSQTTVDLSWTASTDNVGVEDYQVMNGGSVLKTVNGTSTTITGLSEATQYTLSVRARDAADNISGLSNSVTFTTDDGSGDDGGELQNDIAGNGNIDVNDVSDMWFIDVGVNATSMQVVLTCDGSDFDTYGRFNVEPTTSTYDWRGYTSGGEDNTVSNPSEGRHYIMVQRYSGEGSYTLKATITYESGGDTEAPTTPSNLSHSNVTQTTVDLSWTASTDNEGVTGYDVLNGSTVVKSTTGTGTSTTVDGLISETQYTLVVRAKDAAGNLSGLSNSVTFTTDGGGNDPTYCSAKSNNTSYESISRVQFGSIDQSSGSNGYEDFTSVSTTLSAGSTTTLSITTEGNYSTDELVVFIDYNRDGDFTDSGEEVYHNADAGSAQTYSTSVSAPTDAASGNLRMRIILYDTNYNPKSSCGDFNYGEVEDYTVIITGASGPYAKTTTDISDVINNMFTVYPNPNKGEFTVELFESKQGEIRLYNTNGQMIIGKQVNGERVIPININLTPGLYILKVNIANEEISEKVIIQ